MAGQLRVTVHAAGGVVWRHRDDVVEVLLVHRPASDDWSFPKGKADRSDADLETTARREVYEESGHRCVTGDSLVEVEYVDRKGRFKRVTYWEMHALEGTFRPNREVDEIAWVDVEQVGAVLTYERDSLVLDAFCDWHRARRHLVA